jgi:excisionase family DNA binding protein
MSNGTMPRRWLTVAQAAEYLGVSLVTIQRWYDAGILSGYRTRGEDEGARRIWLDSAEAVRRAREQGEGPENGS